MAFHYLHRGGIPFPQDHLTLLEKKKQTCYLWVQTSKPIDNNTFQMKINISDNKTILENNIDGHLKTNLFVT